MWEACFVLKILKCMSPYQQVMLESALLIISLLSKPGNNRLELYDRKIELPLLGSPYLIKMSPQINC